MKFGQGWSSRWLRRGLGLLAALLAGCAAEQPQMDRALMAREANAAPGEQVGGEYQLKCPDVLSLEVPARADLSGRKVIDAEGRIDLGTLGRLRVEGRTASEVARYLADVAGVAASSVQVRVVEFNSQQVYLVGQVVGWQRTVTYRGPETIQDLLGRAGGITPGAASDDVYVVRSRVAEGQQPEVFHVNLRGIVMDYDERTNLRLQPFDQVYVGETRRSRLRNCVPFCVRPLYEAVCGLRSSPATSRPPLIETGGKQAVDGKPTISVQKPEPGSPRALPAFSDELSLGRP